MASVQIEVSQVAQVCAWAARGRVQLALDFGDNPIVATGTDRAGNRGTAQVVVTRPASGTGIILTSPFDHSQSEDAPRDDGNMGSGRKLETD